MSGPTHLRSPYIQRKGANAPSAARCRFIKGEKPYGDTPYCDKPTVDGTSWCRRHYNITHIPMDVRAHKNLTALAEFLARKYR